MNLKQLEAFVKVADCESFSKAARELFITQPTVSAHVLSLEKELACRLFIRNTKEVRLSPDGKKLYVYGRQMLDLDRQIKLSFNLKEDNDNQGITIAASTIPSQYLLPKILKNFYDLYPNEQIITKQTDSAGVVRQILDHDAEIGFTGTALEKRHCRYMPFYKDQLVIITPNTEKYQDFAKVPGNIHWVEHESFIMREEGSGTRKEALKQLKTAGIDPAKINIIASMENQEMIKKSVQQGMGISALSRLASEDEVKDEKILAFTIPRSNKGRDINLVYNKNYKLSRSAERFVKVVKDIYLSNQ
ncbi:MAG: LysR family transcriptional regulator [Lachnospiraceae bacterium]|jgi:DNA-binding transcriptional LysR family regulator|nr:LysR family transcriptional regulator [Lachnospiraceae bacterium]